MSTIKGIVVRLKTSTTSWAGTNDHIYIGVVGKQGGREFPLDVRGFNDFEKGTDIKYWFGTVWEGGALTGAKKPYQSSPESGKWNDPAPDNIELSKVDYVYLRKAGDRTIDEDDAYILDDVTVTLYGSQEDKRVFQTTANIGLANEFGVMSWLREK